MASPDIPADRAAALRAALAATLADPEMIAYAKKHNLALEPGSADELDRHRAQALATPKAVAAKARDVMESLKSGR